MVSPVLFYEALQKVPENAIVIEIAPNALLQAIIKRSVPKSCDVIGMMRKGKDMEFFLSNLGR